MDGTHESWLTAVQMNTCFSTAAPLRPAKGGMLYDAQGHKIEAHSTRTFVMRLGPEGQQSSEYKRGNADPQHGKVVKQGYRFEGTDWLQNVER